MIYRSNFSFLKIFLDICFPFIDSLSWGGSIEIGGERGASHDLQCNHLATKAIQPGKYGNCVATANNWLFSWEQTLKTGRSVLLNASLHWIILIFSPIFVLVGQPTIQTKWNTPNCCWAESQPTSHLTLLLSGQIGPLTHIRVGLFCSLSVTVSWS